MYFVFDFVKNYEFKTARVILNKISFLLKEYFGTS